MSKKTAKKFLIILITVNIVILLIQAFAGVKVSPVGAILGWTVALINLIADDNSD